MRYIAILAAALIGYFAISYTLTQHERQECAQWQKDYNSLSGPALRLFLQQWQPWQEAQCEAVGVSVM